MLNLKTTCVLESNPDSTPAAQLAIGSGTGIPLQNWVPVTELLLSLGDGCEIPTVVCKLSAEWGKETDAVKRIDMTCHFCGDPAVHVGVVGSLPIDIQGLMYSTHRTAPSHKVLLAWRNQEVCECVA